MVERDAIHRVESTAPFSVTHWIFWRSGRDSNPSSALEKSSTCWFSKGSHPLPAKSPNLAQNLSPVKQAAARIHGSKVDSEEEAWGPGVDQSVPPWPPGWALCARRKMPRSPLAVRLRPRHSIEWTGLRRRRGKRGSTKCSEHSKLWLNRDPGSPFVTCR